MGYKKKRRDKTMSHRKRKKCAAGRGGGETEKASEQSLDQSRSSNSSIRAASLSKVYKTVLPVHGRKRPTGQKRSRTHEDSDAAVEHLEDAARHDARLRSRLQHRELGAEAAPLLFHLDVQRAGLAA